MRLDRGPSFSGYYLTDPSAPQHLLSMRPLNAWPCGAFMQDGVLRAVTFIHFLKDLGDVSDDPQFAETFDVGVTCYDNIKQNPDHILNKLMKDSDLTLAIEELKPVPRYLVDKDVKEGKKGEEIVETRAGILVGEFLGFTLADVLRDFPEIWQPTTVDGVEVANVWKCSLEEL